MRYLANRFFLSMIGKRHVNPNAMYVELTFASAPSLSSEIAILPYDNKVAFVQRFDDGYKNAYFNFFRMCFGGLPDAGGYIHAGRKYNDKCGNEQIFGADFAVPLLDTAGNDMHVSSTQNLTWDEMAFCRDFGYSFIFHDYGYPDYSTYTTADEFVLNHQNWRDYVKTKLGIESYTTTLPNGDAVFSSYENRCPWLEAGFWGMSSRLDHMDFGTVRHYNDFNGTNLDNATNAWFTEGWMWPCIYYYQYAANGLTNFQQYVTDAINASGHRLISMFMHGVSYDSSSYPYTSMAFQVAFTEWMENTYGRKGTGQLINCTSQSIMEYTYCRLNTVINTYYNGNKVILEIIPPVMPMRRPALTIKLNSNLNVLNCEVYNIDKFSQNIVGKQNGLINVEWSAEYYFAADRFVTQAESSHLQSDVDLAQYLTNLVSIPSKRDILQARINAIVVVQDETALIDIGPSTTGYSVGPPWNNLTDLVKDIPNLMSTGNTYTGMGIKESTTYPFSVVDTTGVNSGNNSYIYPDKATKDHWMTSTVTGNFAELILYNLDVTKLYTIKCYGARHTLDRITRYTVYYVDASGTAETVSSATLRLKNNYTDVVTFDNLKPYSDGTIRIRVQSETAAQNGYINVLEVIKHY